MLDVVAGLFVDLLARLVPHAHVHAQPVDWSARSAPSLLGTGADPDVMSTDGRNSTALCFAILNEHKETVKLLLDWGVDVNLGMLTQWWGRRGRPLCGNRRLQNALCAEREGGGIEQCIGQPSREGEPH